MNAVLRYAGQVVCEAIDLISPPTAFQPVP